MKQIFLAVVFFSFALLSCNKPGAFKPVPATLEGSWKMIAVKDNTSATVTTKPSSIQMDVNITFSATSNNSGTFYGNTPANNISKNNYFTGANRLLTIPALTMTKVEETSWGNEFVSNIRDAQDYSFDDNGNLYIETIKKTLTFQRQ